MLEVKAGNERAAALYRRLGFVEVGRRRAFYADGADALLMRRRADAGGDRGGGDGHDHADSGGSAAAGG